MSELPAWQVGDRVLAPWEPLFAYAGTIQHITAARALIEFDDGDSGEAYLEDLAPLAFEVGQAVFCRHFNDDRYSPATIDEIDGDSLAVRFEDGEEWVTVSMVRVLRVSQTQLANLERQSDRQRVLTPFLASALFAEVPCRSGFRGWSAPASSLSLKIEVAP